ncbi:hypothetical protein BGZ98_002775 [Dissophora globulifera]|nr:hypothetical protein BGZ98_002775 [Dissophora globulifera]
MGTSVSLSSAHSWLDCTNMLPSGCAGFPLGYPSRADRDINTKYTYLVQDRRPDAPLCQPGIQNIPGNNPFPVASVSAGQELHLTWQPDGHLDDAHPSTIEVHWSGIPGRQLYTRSELSPATLLGTMVFGTSANCDQPWEPNTWCHGHITLPAQMQPGTYQLIWWWKYDRNPSGEEYSTCFEIVVNGWNLQARDLPVYAMAQMVDSSYSPTASTAFIGESASVDHSVPKTATLKDLASKPDQPLSVVPNFAIDEDSNKNKVKSNDYVDDATGILAGDAINDSEGEDTSPVTFPSPSQLINSTLSEQVRTNRAKIELNGDSDLKKDTTLSKNSTQSNSPLSNNTAGNMSNSTGIPSFRPDTTGMSEHSGTHNQSLVGQPQKVDSGATELQTNIGLFSTALAILTWTML